MPTESKKRKLTDDAKLLAKCATIAEIVAVANGKKLNAEALRQAMNKMVDK